MVFIYLIHNVIIHPVAGVIWFLSDIASSIGLSSVGESLDKAGNSVHDFIWNRLDDDDT